MCFKFASNVIPENLKNSQKLDKVVLVGINYTGTASALRGCINDVCDIKEHLRVSLDCHEENTPMRILTEANHDPKFHPTRSNIIAALNWLVEGATDQSSLFFHYSGHGSYLRDANGDESDGRDECICPLDYHQSGMITDDLLRALLVVRLPAGAKLWVISDSCHSGSVVDLRYNYQINVQDNRNEYLITTDTHYAESAGQVVLFSGCRDEQTSADAWIASKSKFAGALTYSFLESIRELKNSGKEITYKRLMKQLLLKLQGGGYTQTPQISSGRPLTLEEIVEIC